MYSVWHIYLLIYFFLLLVISFVLNKPTSGHYLHKLKKCWYILTNYTTFFSLGATTPIGGCILQPYRGLYPPRSRGFLITYNDAPQSVGLLWTNDQISPSQRPLPDNTQHSQQTNIHAPGGIRTHNRSRRAAVDLRLRPRGHWDRRITLRAPTFLSFLKYCSDYGLFRPKLAANNRNNKTEDICVRRSRYLILF